MVPLELPSLLAAMISLMLHFSTCLSDVAAFVLPAKAVLEPLPAGYAENSPVGIQDSGLLGGFFNVSNKGLEEPHHAQALKEVVDAVDVACI